MSDPNVPGTFREILDENQPNVPGTFEEAETAETSLENNKNNVPNNVPGTFPAPSTDMCARTPLRGAARRLGSRAAGGAGWEERTRGGGAPQPRAETPGSFSVISDATAPALIGMSSRSFKEAVRRQGVPHVRLGCRVLVMVSDLARLANADASTGPVEPAMALVPSITSVDDVLAQLGRRRIA